MCQENYLKFGSSSYAQFARMLYTVVHMNLHTFFERLLLLNKEAIRDLILLWILHQLFDNKIRTKRDLQ